MKNIPSFGWMAFGCVCTALFIASLAWASRRSVEEQMVRTQIRIKVKTNSTTFQDRLMRMDSVTGGTLASTNR